LLSGLITGLIIQACVVIFDKLGGVSQASGWFEHQNLLGMATHFVVYPALAAFLAGHYIKRTSAALVAALIVAWGGGSRATIGLMCIGIALTIIFSCWHRSTSRKTVIAALSIASLAAAGPILYSAVERRSPEMRAASNEERNRMTDAAAMIIVDYPFGTGANRFVSIANVGGYYPRARVAWTSAAAPVHNTYYLIAAELGLLGLATFLAMILAALSLIVRILRRSAPTFGAEYALGATVVIVTVAAHAYVEWITMSFAIHALFAMMLGVLAALRGRAGATTGATHRGNVSTYHAEGSSAPA
jgi:O-antigen ligase